VLGLALIGVGAGGIVGSASSAAAIDRFGSRLVVGGAAGMLAVALPLVAAARSPWSLAAVLGLVGALDALDDIAMNAQGVALQRATGRSIMTRLHACWSVGALVGALGGAAAAHAGISLGRQLLLTGALLAIAAGLIVAVLDPDDRARPQPAERASRHDGRRGVPWRRVVRLPGPALALGAVAFATAIVENAPHSWSALLLHDRLGASPATAGLGLAAFTAAMVSGRVFGDAVVDARGPVTTFRAASGLVAAGLIGVALAPGPAGAVAGFALWGLGVSVLFPLLYGAAGSLDALGPGGGLAIMSVGARMGFLVEPPTVGWLAERSHLARGLAIAVGGALAAAALGGRVLRARGLVDRA